MNSLVVAGCVIIVTLACLAFILLIGAGIMQGA